MVRKMMIFSSEFGSGPNSKSHNFTIRFEQPLGLSNKPHYLSLISADLWYSNYNIDNTNYDNGTFRYFDGTAYQTINIKDGQYTFTNLISIIEAGLFANGDYTGTAPDIAYNIVIKPNYNTGKVEFTLGTGYKIDFSTNLLHIIFGCDKVEYSASFESPNKGNITNGINNYNVCCSLVNGNGVSGAGENSNVIGVFVPNTPPNSNINFQPKLTNQILISQPTAREVTISIRDQTGRLIDLENEPVSVAVAISDV